MRRVLIPFLMVAAQALSAAGFDPAKDVALSVAGGALFLRLPDNVHLKARSFKVALVSRGSLTCAPLPATSEIDDAGDPILRGTVRLALAGWLSRAGYEVEALRLAAGYTPADTGPVRQPVRHSAGKVPERCDGVPEVR